MKDAVMVSPTLENFIEVLYELLEQDAHVRVTDLSKKLRIAKSSVNQAVASLVKQGLVQHENYGPVILTETGVSYALELRRRHAILKAFFSDVLLVDPENADQDARIIEHVISETTLARLAAYLVAHEDLLPEVSLPVTAAQAVKPETAKRTVRKQILEIGKATKAALVKPCGLSPVPE
jgi:Mn-dependent transcriptional regulator